MSPYDHQVLTLLDTATSLIPELTKSTKDPIRTVLVEKDDSRVLGWREREDERPMDRLLTDGEEMIVDFGGREFSLSRAERKGPGRWSRRAELPWTSLLARTIQTKSARSPSTSMVSGSGTSCQTLQLGSSLRLFNLLCLALSASSAPSYNRARSSLPFFRDDLSVLLAFV
jgi:hypothetical protein